MHWRSWLFLYQENQHLNDLTISSARNVFRPHNLSIPEIATEKQTNKLTNSTNPKLLAHNLLRYLGAHKLSDLKSFLNQDWLP